MVDPELVNRAKLMLGSRPRKILVTGATGFVGRQLAQTLSAAGHEVTATGRNRYLAPPETPFVRADIRSADEASDLCRGQEVVIHCASDTSVWGPYHHFFATNVQGTRNIVAGCLRHGVSRLVHVSSTSIQFGFRDTFDLSENSDPPKKFACNYAESKFEAEQVIQEACDQGLNAIIVRARAVYGPGDQSLLPKLLSVYDKGRLRQIGKGTNITDLTYIDNLVYALMQAIDHGRSGTTCTITGEDPVTLWNLIRRILDATGRNKALKRVPYPIAMGFAKLSETVHHLLGLHNEPALTRYAVGLLAKSQTFSTANAKQELNYSPIVSQAEGIDRTIKFMTARTDTHSSISVRVRLFTTGYTENWLHRAQRGADRIKVPFHAMVALIEHPRHGLTLFDTGYATRLYDATSRWPFRTYAKITPVTTSSELACINRLKETGFDPADVRRIVLSHFHADHICGLRDFPNADIIATAEAWESVARKKGVAALRHAFLPEMLPEDLADRLYLLPSFSDPGIGPFPHCHDLFADGSVRLIELPGHAQGQIGALLQTDENKQTLLVADAAWTRATISENLTPTLAFRALADNYNHARQSLRRLHEFHLQYPDVELVPTHCRSVATEQGFDKSCSGRTESSD